MAGLCVAFRTCHLEGVHFRDRSSGNLLSFSLNSRKLNLQLDGNVQRGENGEVSRLKLTEIGNHVDVCVDSGSRRIQATVFFFFFFYFSHTVFFV